MKPYNITLYYKSEKSGKISTHTVTRMLLSEALQLARIYARKYNYQYLIRRQGSSEIVASSAETGYIRPDEIGQLSLWGEE